MIQGQSWLHGEFEARLGYKSLSQKEKTFLHWTSSVYVLVHTDVCVHI